MKRLITFCLISMITFYAQAQRQVHPNDSAFARITHDILTKQSRSGSAQKTTATAKRLIATSRYAGTTLTDSSYHGYRNYLGSTHSTEESYYVNNPRGIGYYDATNPLHTQTIKADTSFNYIVDGSGFHFENGVVNNYDAGLNLVNVTYIQQNITYKDTVINNANGQRSIVITRDSSGSGTFSDLYKHYYTYDNQNRIVRDSSIYLPLSVADYKADYYYNTAGYLSSYETFEPTLSGWEGINKVELSYDGNNRLVKSTGYFFNGTAWQLNGLDSFGYTGSFTQHTYRMLSFWDPMQSKWEADNGEIIELDGSGRMAKRYFIDPTATSFDTSQRWNYFYNVAGLFDYVEGANHLGNGNFGQPSLFMRYYYEDYQTTAINNVIVEKSQFSVYPNPATDRLNIAFDKPLINAATFTIHNLQGQILMRHSEQPGKHMADIDVSDLPPGRYFIQNATTPSDAKNFLIIQ